MRAPGYRAGLFAVLAAAVVSIACGSGKKTASQPRPLLLSEAAAVSAYPTPAKWRYHPRAPATLRARANLPDGGILYAGQRGERWSVHPSSRIASAAAELAPEEIVAVLNPAPNRWLFVGRTGGAYEAGSPLGSFLRASAPLDPLVRVAAAGSSIVGIRQDGALVRTVDMEGTWSRVGPDTATFADVIVAPDGGGLAVAVPEELFSTTDFGATWKRLTAPTVGGYGFFQDESAGITLASVLGYFEYRRGAQPPLVDLGRAPRLPAYELGADVPLGPSAMAIAEGRAAVLGTRYFEIRSSGRASEYELLYGEVTGALRSRPLPAAKPCRAVKIAGHGPVLYVACVHQTAQNATQRLELFRSDDGGLHVVPEPLTMEGKLSELRMAVGAGGTLILSGICPSNAGGQGCRPFGVYYRRLGRRRVPELAPSATPALTGSASALVFSADGERAFALGRRSKSRALAVFVSADGGRTFEPHEADEVSVPDDDGPFVPDRQEAFEVEAANAAEDGTVAFVVRHGAERTLLVTDEDGRVLSVAAPPSKGARIGAAGNRAVAVSPASGQAWESLDGGASWVTLGTLPLDLCPRRTDCDAEIACHVGGCIVADVLSRVGWNGQADEGGTLVVAPASSRGRGRDPRVRVPYACSLNEGQWRTLPRGTAVPRADQMALGEVAWFALLDDPSSASVSTLHAYGGKNPRLEEMPLLKPARAPADTAYVATLQVEGAAALRYSVPGRSGTDAEIRNVEVAWDNLIEGKILRAAIPAAGGYRPGDFEQASGMAQRANPALLSISAGGVYVRIHGPLGDAQTTFFLDGRAVESVPAVPWPAAALRGGRSEMARVDGTHVPLRILQQAVIRARRSDGGYRFDAMAIGWNSPADFGFEQSFDVAYTDGRSGIQSTVSDVFGKKARSVIYPFRVEGEVLDAGVEVPTQLALGDQPRRCSDFQKKNTPRVVAPFQPGTRHPIIVTDPLEPARILITEDAVLHGKADSACAAAFSAEIVSTESGSGAPGAPGASGGSGERAILSLEDLEHAWLFRVIAGEKGRENRVEYKTMSCRLDPQTEVPPEVFRAKGTSAE